MDVAKAAIVTDSSADRLVHHQEPCSAGHRQGRPALTAGMGPRCGADHLQPAQRGVERRLRRGIPAAAGMLTTLSAFFNVPAASSEKCGLSGHSSQLRNSGKSDTGSEWLLAATSTRLLYQQLSAKAADGGKLRCDCSFVKTPVWRDLGNVQFQNDQLV